MNFNCGRLDESITIQTRTEGTADAVGAAAITYPTLATVSAEVTFGTGRSGGGEKFEQDRDTATNIASFLCRYRSDVIEKDRISWDLATWDIVHIARYRRKNFMILKAQKKV